MGANVTVDCDKSKLKFLCDLPGKHVDGNKFIKKKQRNKIKNVEEKIKKKIENTFLCQRSSKS